MNFKFPIRTIIFFVLLCIIVGIIAADLFYTFGNYDTPFVIAFSIYVLSVMVRRVSSRTAFTIALFFVVLMSYFYMRQGSVRLSERLGEWFYLFFISGLIHYGLELRKIEKGGNFK